MHKALYSLDTKDAGTVKCLLCPHSCVLAPGNTGICGVRKNDCGKLYTLTYDKFTSVNVDPIEKKPLYHFLPGTKVLSVGTIGCNFKCSFCQNWEISQASFGSLPLQILTSADALALAKESSSAGIAYTYNEPFINFEWLLQTAALFKRNKLKNILVTNGYVNKAPLEEIGGYIDAANVDLKAFNDDFYKKICGGSLKPVMNCIESMIRIGIHVEVTTLLVPGENDSPREVKALVKWLAGLSPSIPLHFSRYFPQYKMKTPMTTLKDLIDVYNTAKEKLKYVYIGNVYDQQYNNTYCPQCRALLVERYGYDINIRGVKDNKCVDCGCAAGLKGYY